ncbi:nitric oxide reductase activation protein NorD [Desulfosediminicola flagellatus]|uniref:nitric oxide reductase activation protein NorD n=1 Tax=Desulfosediminicola flagellatus TaxID=2569541 RepID=UPI0010AC77F2|nr:VWA domain-containing protein [Desulfosediminicola flagellatus]
MSTQLKKHFYQQVSPSLPNDWEVEEGLEPLIELEKWQQDAVLALVHVVWPVSNSLCFSYIQYAATNIGKLGATNLNEWVRQLLDHYEREGLGGARAFMSDVDENFFRRIAGEAGTDLSEVRGRLLPFIRGVSSLSLDISVSETAWTDSAVIYLPKNINYFLSPSQNQSYYTFLACCQWGYLLLGTLTTDVDSSHFPADSKQAIGGSGRYPVEEFFALFPDPQLAINIFHLYEFSRVVRMLNRELPGLMRRITPLLSDLLDRLAGQGMSISAFYSHMSNLVSETESLHSRPEEGEEESREGDRHANLARVVEIYESFSTNSSSEDWCQFNHLTGIVQFNKVREQAERRRAEEKTSIIQQIANFLEHQLDATENTKEENDVDVSAEAADGSRIVISLLKNTEENRGQISHKIRLNNEEFELPPEISDLVNRITTDLGKVPEGYLQAAAGIAGRAKQTGGGGGTEVSTLKTLSEATLYDEWDYRRQGYRKNWCALIEKEITPVRSQFVNKTLIRYRGMILRLRRQFEMLRTRHRFIRRRRYGDDIDFDALVEAVGDRLAGLTPSDRLFIRLQRDERDIAVMFLVDMSNSTEGWVGKAIKESLVLLCDVLEVVGDKYGIYGFSGMRRSRCELFKIKEMEERYGELVQQRICAISPREYTRMAPPIRHLTNMLVKTEAKVKLLITISDGKPEDYDDYRGEYAIEDTRQALIETRGKGVIPFCITVDQEAHSYLSHMFGKGNYIYVDGVDKLPARMPEIYRLLTH